MTRPFYILLLLLSLSSCVQKKSKSPNKRQLKVPTKSTLKSQSEIDTTGYNYDNEVKTLGIGLIIAPEKFSIFNDSLLTRKYEDIDMNQEKINIYSKFYKPDYGLMHFICIGITDKSYQIILNYSEVKYLPKSKKYDFKNWEDYILQSYGIRRLTKETGAIAIPQPLKTEPKDTSKELSIPKGYENFCPMKVEGDWVEVKFDCFYNDENDTHEGQPCHDYIDQCQSPVKGWLRWRKGKKLLIDIFLMP